MDIILFSSAFLLIALASRQAGIHLLKTGLPLISAFLLTGMVAGPHILNMISEEAVKSLGFIDEISIAFIAFAAGGELYLKELKPRLKSIAWISLGIVIFTFFMAASALMILSENIPFMQQLSVEAKIAIAILTGAILVARSPSSAIAIVNELRAKGRFTQTILGVTIISDVAVIAVFAFSSSAADALLTGLGFDLFTIVLFAGELAVSVLIGFGVSRLIAAILYLPLPQLAKTIFILCTGYLVYDLSAFARSFSHQIFSVEILLEPLLICMTAGFMVSNHTRFRDEFLKLLSDAGPLIYIAFFTLTGASLSLDILITTWPIALALVFVRLIAIFAGSFIGSFISGNPLRQSALGWMAYITQAGVGLGLAKEVAVEFPQFGDPFATLIITIIVINQLIGPPLFKCAVKLMGEDHSKADFPSYDDNRSVVIFGADSQASALSFSLTSQGWDVVMAAVDTQPIGNDHENNRIIPVADIDIPQLKKIGADTAQAVVAMLSDEQNLNICRIAFETFGTRTLIVRLNDRNEINSFHELGALIVDPSTALVSLMDHFVRAPDAASLLMGMNTEQTVADLPMKNPALTGIALRDLRLPFDLIIMSIRRRGVLFVPHGFTRIEAGDLVTVLGSEPSIKELALRFDANATDVVVQMVKKAADKNLPADFESVRNLLKSRKDHPRDRFDILIQSSLIHDLKGALNLETFFKWAAGQMSSELDISADVLEALLMEREAEITTVISPGLAVPHIIVPGNNIFKALIVRAKKGIIFSEKKPPVYAAFILIGSKDERNFHLQALSAIAQIVLDPQFERKWRRAKNIRHLKNILLDAPRKNIKAAKSNKAKTGY